VGEKKHTNRRKQGTTEFLPEVLGENENACNTQVERKSIQLYRQKVNQTE